MPVLPQDHMNTPGKLISSYLFCLIEAIPELVQELRQQFNNLHVFLLYIDLYSWQCVSSESLALSSLTEYKLET